MDLGSEFTLSALNHSNITIHRHPTFYTPIHNPDTMLRWSHHEKVVVVDRSIAFVGGIDLAFGRWDTHSHDLTDNYHPHQCVLDDKHHHKDQCVLDDKDHHKDPCVLDHQNQCVLDQKDPLVLDQCVLDHKDPFVLDQCALDHKEECSQANGEEPTEMHTRWVGKDYGNTFFGGDRSNFDEPLKDYIDRKVTPRMPWHDIACSFNGSPALDVARHFIQRFNYINSWKFWERSPLSIDDCSWGHHPDTLHHDIHEPSSGDVKIQVLRSVGSWSAGKRLYEESIHMAYLHSIENSKHFIYIENQFFISSQFGDYYLTVENKVQLALCERIVRAYHEREDFHVTIVMPLQPELRGTDSGRDREAVCYWNYATLYHGKESLMNRLKERAPGIVLEDYISVYGLRAHGILEDELVTEIVYVHSKLMIVDDRLTIVGSANINDRSMLGFRDSEVDVIIEDREMIDGHMNGNPYPVGKFSHGLRFHLQKEHLGLLDADEDMASIVKDPLKYKSFVFSIASSNTNIYDQVFRRKVIPTNSVFNYKELERRKTFPGLVDVSPDEAKEELGKIHGKLVLFPENFLRDELKSTIYDYGFIYVDNRGLPANPNDGGVTYA